jgi:hypothetical protein
MKEDVLDTIRNLIQEDPGNRGLRTDPQANLVTACPHDFGTACRSIAEAPAAVLAVVTGFYIPHAQPPCGETDGPLGTLWLARALTPLGIRMGCITDAFCTPALQAGLAACDLANAVPVLTLPDVDACNKLSPRTYTDQVLAQVRERVGSLTHLIALERVGPSHTPDSVQSQAGSTPADRERFVREVPSLHYDRCHTMKGRDITAHMSPAHWLFEAAPKILPVRTLGIGDGGNEIGMGKIPWEIIRRNIAGGGLVACRVPVDDLIVCGVSNWGAYGLGAGVRWLRGAKPDKELFDRERERQLLQIMVEKGPLVDGVSGQPSVTVDGLSFERYTGPLRQLGALLI